MPDTTHVVTGATGFLGSHLVAGLLESNPDRLVVCLARGRDGAGAEERVRQAIGRALDDRGTPDAGLERCERLRVVATDLLAPGMGLDLPAMRQLAALRPAEFWHCACAAAVPEDAGGGVWATNVEGTRAALAVATGLGVSVFNHLSTAQVAGGRTGTIPEAIPPAPPDSLTLHDQSKLTAEQLVHEFCREDGPTYRIFRPGILVGHSRTGRACSTGGLYHALYLARRLRAMTAAKPMPGRRPVRLRIDPRATLNLMPVDLAVAEMLDLSACGDRSTGQVFHLTNEAPLEHFPAAALLLSLVGVPAVENAGAAGRLGAIDQLFQKTVTHYDPYCDGARTYDRGNVARHGADRHQKAYRLDLERFRALLECRLGPATPSNVA